METKCVFQFEIIINVFISVSSIHETKRFVSCWNSTETTTLGQWAYPVLDFNLVINVLLNLTNGSLSLQFTELCCRVIMIVAKYPFTMVIQVAYHGNRNAVMKQKRIAIHYQIVILLTAKGT